MIGYVPPYTITNTMLELVSGISEKIGKISSHKNLESKPHLRRNNRIHSVHSSLKIEANSLSFDDVRDVINGKTVLGNQVEIQEVKNAYAAYEMIPEIDPFNLKDLKKMHGIMTNLTVKESGVFRNNNEGVFSGETCIFMAPPPNMVSSLMNDLMDWMSKNKDTVHPLIMSAVFHYELVFIHPFTDGNGRIARLWHTTLLYRWKPIFEYVPLESEIEKYQEQYYMAISQSHANGNSNVFIEFMLAMIDKVLDEVITQTMRQNSELSEYVKRLLTAMEYDIPYTANDIMQLLNLKSKETLRKNYLKPAMDLGLIHMTIPKKPNSRNQRYVK